MTTSKSKSTSSTSSTSTINLKTLAAHSIYATLLASNPIQDLRTKSRTKSDGTLVTDADGAAQRIIYNEIRSLNENVRIVGEESDFEMNHPMSTSTSHTTSRNNHPNHDDNLLRSVKSEIDLCHCRDQTYDDYLFCLPPTPTLTLHHNHTTTTTTTTNQQHTNIVDVSRVSVFVDPLDGTSSYAKGDYEAVTILVAIILDNIPVFGLIVKPFKIGTDLHCFMDTKCTVLYGGTLLGGTFVMGGKELKRSRDWRITQTYKHQMSLDNNHNHHNQQNHLTQTNNGRSFVSISPISAMSAIHIFPAPSSSSTESSSPCQSPCPANATTSHDTKRNRNSLNLQHRRAIISKSRRGGVVQKCIDSLSALNLLHEEPIYITGAGYKTMKLLIGENDETLWFFPKPGTSLWDVAAADALLRVMGGRISDKFGRDLDYGKGRLEADNLDGIIACSDEVLHAKCLELYKKEGWE